MILLMNGKVLSNDACVPRHLLGIKEFSSDIIASDNNVRLFGLEQANIDKLYRVLMSFDHSSKTLLDELTKVFEKYKKGDRNTEDHFIVLFDQYPEVLQVIKKNNLHLYEVISGELYYDLSKHDLFLGLSPEDLKLYFKNLAVLQLENKCCVGCPWCGLSLNNQDGPYKQLDVKLVRTIFKYLKESGGSLGMMYHESDPLSYRMPLRDGSEIYYDYFHLHDLYYKMTGNGLHFTTVVPKGSENLLLKALKEGRINELNTTHYQIGLSHINKARLEKKIDGKENLLEQIEQIEFERDLKKSEREDSIIKEVIKLLRQKYSHLPTNVFDWNIDGTEIKIYQYVFILQKAKKMLTQKHPLTLDEFSNLFQNGNIYRNINHKKLGFNETFAGGIPASEYAELLTKTRQDFYQVETLPPKLKLEDVEPREIGNGLTNTKASHYITSLQEHGIASYNGGLITPDNVYNSVNIGLPNKDFPDGLVVRKVMPKDDRSENFPLIDKIEKVVDSGIVKIEYSNGLNTSFRLLNDLNESFVDYTIVRKDGKVYAIQNSILMEVNPRFSIFTRFGRLNEITQEGWNILQEIVSDKK